MIWKRGVKRPLLVIALDGTTLWGPFPHDAIEEGVQTVPCKVHLPDGHEAMCDAVHRGVRWDEIDLYQLTEPILHAGEIH